MRRTWRIKEGRRAQRTISPCKIFDSEGGPQGSRFSFRQPLTTHSHCQSLCHTLLYFHRHVDSFESMSFAYRHGGVDANLCGEHAFFSRWIDAPGSESRHDDEIHVALNAGGDCPLDICRIVNVNVVIDDDGVLDVRHCGKQKMQNLLR